MVARPIEETKKNENAAHLDARRPCFRALFRFPRFLLLRPGRSAGQLQQRPRQIVVFHQNHSKIIEVTGNGRRPLKENAWKFMKIQPFFRKSRFLASPPPPSLTERPQIAKNHTQTYIAVAMSRWSAELTGQNWHAPWAWSCTFWLDDPEVPRPRQII